MNQLKTYSFLPLVFLKFWFIDTPLELLRFFGSVNSAFFQLFSLPPFLRTFFKPLKNEYREGLIGFSRVMGMGIKSMFIMVDLLLLVLLLAVEASTFLFIVLFPFLTVWLLFL